MVEALSSLEKHFMLKTGLLILAEVKMERNVLWFEEFQDSH